MKKTASRGVARRRVRRAVARCAGSGASRRELRPRAELGGSWLAGRLRRIVRRVYAGAPEGRPGASVVARKVARKAVARRVVRRAVGRAKCAAPSRKPSSVAARARRWAAPGPSGGAEDRGSPRRRKRWPRPTWAANPPMSPSS